jgi:hypothetical protein
MTPSTIPSRPAALRRRHRFGHLAKMQAGATLQFQHHSAGLYWQINGRPVPAEVARLIILRNDVIGDADTLFGDVHSQTYRATNQSGIRHKDERAPGPSSATATAKDLQMRKEDLFPSKYLKCEDLNGKLMVVTIKAAPVETLKSPDGKSQEKAVLYFAELKKCLPLNLTNFDSVADIAGDDTDGWVGTKVELHPAKTQMAGRTVDCIRIRRPGQPAPKKSKPVPSTEINDEIISF